MGIRQQPAVLRSCTQDGFWTLETLDKIMPQLLDAKKAHDEEVKAKAWRKRYNAPLGTVYIEAPSSP